jgi:CRP-like cAMP-binding protein
VDPFVIDRRGQPQVVEAAQNRVVPVPRVRGVGEPFGDDLAGLGRRNATVTAVSAVQLAVLFGTEFRTLEDRHPDVGEPIKQKVIERVERAQRATPRSTPS